MTLIEKLVCIQDELKAPKGQRNTFGKYNFRSCEDILEAVKPILKKYEATITLSDEVVVIGDRYYIRATARLSDKDNPYYEVTAYAREDSEVKGMSQAQVTGSTSSYARKYALNGLFAIDNTDDPDTEEVTAKREDKTPTLDEKLVQESKGLGIYDKIFEYAESKKIVLTNEYLKRQNERFKKLQNEKLEKVQNTTKA